MVITREKEIKMIIWKKTAQCRLSTAFSFSHAQAVKKKNRKKKVLIKWQSDKNVLLNGHL